MPNAVALQDFLDHEGDELRRVARLATGSWAAADDAVLVAASELVTSRTDLDDLPAAAARRALCRHLLALPDDRSSSPSRGPATPGEAGEPTASGVEPAGIDARVAATLASLPLPQRLALALRHVARLTDVELADALGTSRDEAMSQASQARAAVEADLARQGDSLADGPVRRATGSTTTHEEFHG